MAKKWLKKKVRFSHQDGGEITSNQARAIGRSGYTRFPTQDVGAIARYLGNKSFGPYSYLQFDHPNSAVYKDLDRIATTKDKAGLDRHIVGLQMPMSSAPVYGRDMFEERSRSKRPKGNELQEYSFGGILSGLGSGAGMGASIGSFFPGIGTLIGGIAGGVAGLAGGIAGHVGENRAEDAQQAAMDEAEKQQDDDAYLATVGSSENPFTPTFPLGGLLPYENAEVEDDEILQRPSGKLKKMSGKRHEQGGIDVTEPVGTKVYSDREVYKPTGKTYAEEADSIRKRIAQLDKML